MSRICGAVSGALYYFNIALNFFFFTLTNGNGEKLRIYLSDGPRCYGNRVQCECFAVRVHSGKKPLSCGLRSEDSCSPGIHEVPEKQESLRGGSAAQRACCSFKRAKFNS